MTNPYSVNSVLFILAPTLTSIFGTLTHHLVLTDCKTYGYMAHMLSRDVTRATSTNAPPRNTVYTCTAYCTKLNRTYSWGLFQQTSHTDIVQHILTLCRHSICVLPTTQRVVFMTPRCVNHLEYLCVRIATLLRGICILSDSHFSSSYPLLY